MGCALRRRACHRPRPQSHPFPRPPPHLQPPTGPQAMANHRQPQPAGRAAAPLHPRALQALRPAHAALVRVHARRRRLVPGDIQVLPQDPRRGVLRPSEVRRRQVRHVRLLRHPVGSLRRVPPPGSQDLHRRALQRQAGRVARVHPRRGSARAAARPARGRPAAARCGSGTTCKWRFSA
jgi:hypothetical protein